MQLLSLGSQGPDVQAVQRQLAQIGYLLKGTGYFGGATDTAVTDFQSKHGLTVDGIVGNETRRAITQAITSPQSVPASVTAAVKQSVARPLWVVEAFKWIGTHEGVGAADNPKIIEWAKEEGGNIAKAFTHDSIPWCALFVNMLMTKCALKGTETLWALDWAGKWPSVKLAGAAVGAVCPMTRSGGGHVMVLIGRDKAGNYVGVGGNQSDAVNVRSFTPARLNQGFWWPSSVTPPAQTGMKTLPLVSATGAVLSTKEG